MKKLLLAVFAIGLAAAMSASAQVTISGSDFNNGALVGAYNGTYVATPSGHMHLAYTTAGDDAVVGAKGPFGTLNGLGMSFDYSNMSGGNGGLPYAAFGLSENSLWNLSAQEFLVIAVSGNQLNDSTLVHVVDNNTGDNYIPLSGAITLGQLEGETFSGVAFGDMQVMRAYAYIGAWPGVGNTSVDINSITVVPEPATVLLVAFGGLTALCLGRRARKS
jgi:hypothetical protein